MRAWDTFNDNENKMKNLSTHNLPLISYKWITQHATLKLAAFTDPKGRKMPTAVESLQADHLQTELFL